MQEPTDSTLKTLTMDESRVAAIFKGLSALIYLLNIICAFVFMKYGVYLFIMISIYTVVISSTVLFSILQKPESINSRLHQHCEFLFTYKGRFLTDFFVSLFLFGMGQFGIAMGCLTLIAIIGIRLLAGAFPNAFEEAFPGASGGQQGGGGGSGFSSPYGANDANFPPPTGTSGYAVAQPSADL